jgi:hypothetical protein
MRGASRPRARTVAMRSERDIGPEQGMAAYSDFTGKNQCFLRALAETLQ